MDLPCSYFVQLMDLIDYVESVIFIHHAAVNYFIKMFKLAVKMVLIEVFRYKKRIKNGFFLRILFYIFLFCFVSMFDYWLLAAPLPPVLVFAFAAELLQEAETGEFAPALRQNECWC